MASYSVEYIYRLRDQFSQKVKQLAAASKQSQAAIRASGQAANATAAGYTRLGHAAGTATGRVRKLAYTMRAFRTVQHGMMNFGMLGGGFTAYKVGNTIFNFEDTMNEVRALMSANDSQMAILQNKVIEVGAKSRYTASEVASGLVEIARAGVYDPAVASALIDGVTGLSEATNTPMDRAADIATNIAKSFGKNITEGTMREMVDALAHSTRRTNFDLGELAESMKYVAFNAHKYGLSMNDTIAGLMVLAQRGIKGSTAGTGLSRIIEGALTLSKPALKALDSVQIDPQKLFSKDGKFKLFETIEMFREAEKKFGKVATGEAIYKAFGKRGGRIMSALTESSKEEIESFREIMSGASGAVDEMREARMRGLPGSFRKLVAAAEKAVLSMGEKGGLSSTLQTVSNGLRSLALSFADLPSWMQSAIAHIGLALVAFTAIAVPLGIMSMAIGALGIKFGILLAPLRVVVGLIWALSSGLAIGMFQGLIAGAASAIAQVGILGAILGTLKSLSVIGLVITAVGTGWWLFSNWERVSALLAQPTQVNILFPDAPDWLKWLMRKGAEGWQAVAGMFGGQSPQRMYNMPQPPKDYNMPQLPMPAPNPNRIPQAAGERLKVESTMKGQIEPLAVTVTAPNTITLRLPNGMIAGSVPVGASSNAPRGVSAIDHGSSVIAP